MYDPFGIIFAYAVRYGSKVQIQVYYIAYGDIVVPTPFFEKAIVSPLITFAPSSVYIDLGANTTLVLLLNSKS